MHCFALFFDDQRGKNKEPACVTRGILRVPKRTYSDDDTQIFNFTFPNTRSPLTTLSVHVTGLLWEVQVGHWLRSSPRRIPPTFPGIYKDINVY